VTKEWTNKLWAAKTFGWTPTQVDEMSSKDMTMLIKAHNKEVKETNRKQRMANRGKR